MPLDQIASSHPQSRESGGFSPRLVVIGPDASDISARERSVLAAADVVFSEGNTHGAALALISPATFVEWVSGESEAAVNRTQAISRARKLAADGWRVVWVGSLGSADFITDFNAASVAGDNAHPGIVTIRSADEPQRLATAFNGLAG